MSEWKEVARKAEEFRTGVIATRCGPRVMWQRNSLLARRQRESEELHRLPVPKIRSAVPPTVPMVARAIPTKRSILGYVGDRHWMVAFLTRMAYLMESASAFRSH